jgi:hypothetical protein
MARITFNFCLGVFVILTIQSQAGLASNADRFLDFAISSNFLPAVPEPELQPDPASQFWFLELTCNFVDPPEVVAEREAAAIQFARTKLWARQNRLLKKIASLESHPMDAGIPAVSDSAVFAAANSSAESKRRFSKEVQTLLWESLDRSRHWVSGVSEEAIDWVVDFARLQQREYLQLNHWANQSAVKITNSFGAAITESGRVFESKPDRASATQLAADPEIEFAGASQDSYWQYYEDCERWGVDFSNLLVLTEPAKSERRGVESLGSGQPPNLHELKNVEFIFEPMVALELAGEKSPEMMSPSAPLFLAAAIHWIRRSHDSVRGASLFQDKFESVNSVARSLAQWVLYVEFISVETAESQFKTPSTATLLRQKIQSNIVIAWRVLVDACQVHSSNVFLRIESMATGVQVPTLNFSTWQRP